MGYVKALREVADRGLTMVAGKDPKHGQRLRELRNFYAFLEEEIPKWEMEISLDQLLADLEMEEVHAELAGKLNNDAPEIIFRSSPTNLILVDGDPYFQEIEKTNYERVVNTPYFIVRDCLIQAHGNAKSQSFSRIQRLDDPIIPQPGCTEIGASLVFIFFQNRLLYLAFLCFSHLFPRFLQEGFPGCYALQQTQA